LLAWDGVGRVKPSLKDSGQDPGGAQKSFPRAGYQSGQQRRSPLHPERRRIHSENDREL